MKNGDAIDTGRRHHPFPVSRERSEGATRSKLFFIARTFGRRAKSLQADYARLAARDNGLDKPDKLLL
jgi:hypothetical protein